MGSPNVELTDVEAARVLLARLGVSPEELLGVPQVRPAAPTFAEYIPRVVEVFGEGGGRLYRSYFKRILAQWADRRLDEVSASEIGALVEHTRTHVVRRKNAREGRGAAEHMVNALRCIYKHAVNDGLIDPGKNPAVRVAKPRRLPSTRRGLPDGRVAEIIGVASSTGDDPVLDSLLIRLHVETACRRGGALALRPIDLDPDQALIMLREKGGTFRWQPVSPTLMTHLLNHAKVRGSAADNEGRLLRGKTGRPMGRRRYDVMWRRIREYLAWAERQQISIHWLRHTTLTWVERNFGHAVARAFAGHTDSHEGGATHTYVRAGVHEVAAAVAALTGEPHPLADAAFL